MYCPLSFKSEVAGRKGTFLKEMGLFGVDMVKASDFLRSAKTIIWVSVHMRVCVSRRLSTRTSKTSDKGKKEIQIERAGCNQK